VPYASHIPHTHRFLAHDWKAKYETLVHYVVPRSTRCIVEDEEAGLWSVTLFKTVVDEFKHRAHELRSALFYVLSIPRPPPLSPSLRWRSLSSPHILLWKTSAI